MDSNNIDPSVDLHPATEPGWRQRANEPSLPEAHRSVPIPKGMNFWRKLFAFSGPGFLVAVGYMDPGNWATDIAGGSRYGYALLSVIFISNFMAILLQSLCTKLGIATGRDLAQACRDHYSKPVNICLWLLCEVAICACDLAEVIGSAIALNLLFHIPLVWGVCITALDVLIVMYLQHFGFRYLEALVVMLILTIGGCFLAEILIYKPEFSAVAAGIVPQAAILHDPKMLYIAIGILGATVMPHNLYLHSSIVQTRKYEHTPEGRKEAILFSTIDSTLALMFALFINGAILVVAGAAFYSKGEFAVEKIEDAHKLMTPILGGASAAIFALALLASGQNSTLTGTLAGQIVMEGFVNIRIRPWLRRLITRLFAIVPAVIVTLVYGESGTENLLIFSQVLLSLQLPFAIVPLIIFTSEKAKMGEFANGAFIKIISWTVAAIIIVLNVILLLYMAGVFKTPE